RTAAQGYGRRVIGIVLSGGLDDGTHGLRLVKKRGGIAIVQDAADALVDSMPLSALRGVDVDHVLAASEIGAMIARLTRKKRGNHRPTRRRRTPDVAERGTDALHGEDANRPPSVFTCPECGGTLWEIAEGGMSRFRCHVGHSFGSESLL